MNAASIYADTIADAARWCIDRRMPVTTSANFVRFLTAEHRRYVGQGMSEEAASELLAAWFATGGAWRRFVETHKEPEPITA